MTLIFRCLIKLAVNELHKHNSLVQRDNCYIHYFKNLKLITFYHFSLILKMVISCLVARNMESAKLLPQRPPKYFWTEKKLITVFGKAPEIIKFANLFQISIFILQTCITLYLYIGLSVFSFSFQNVCLIILNNMSQILSMFYCHF